MLADSSKSIRVLVDASSALQGGGVTFATGVIEGLLRRGYSLTVLAPQSLSQRLQTKWDASIDWRQSPDSSIFRLVDSTSRIDRLADAVQASLVLFLGNYGLARTKPAVVVSQLDTRARRWYPWYDMKQRLRWGTREWLMRKSYLRAEHVVTVSEEMARHLEQYYGLEPAKITVIYEGVEQPATSDDPRDRSLAVFAITGPQPYKGGAVLADALSRVARDYGIVPQVAGVSLDQARALGWKGTDGTVKWLGVLPHEMVIELYRDTEVFVYQSCIEAFGLPPLEAMAQGAAVVAPGIPVLRELCETNAVFFDPASAEELHQAISTVLDDPSLRNEKRKGGIQRAQAFNWDNTAGLLAEVIDRVAERKV